MSWEKVEFNDVLEKIVGGGTPSKTIPDYWNGDIPWCSVKDMVGDKYQLYSTEDTITSAGLENSSSNLILAGTVITSTRMGLGRAFINKVDMAINQDLKALIPNQKIDKKFLLWTIVNKKEEIEGLGIGSTVKGIRLEVLRGLKFNLPSLPTQRKIASILSAYDDLIENNLKRIKLLEEKAFVRYKAIVRVEKMNEFLIEEVCETLGGGTPATSDRRFWDEGDILWFSPTDLTKHNSIVLLDSDKKITELGLQKSSAKLVPPKTILMTSRASIGYFGLINKPASTNQGFINIIPFNDNHRAYMLFDLKNRKEEIVGNANGSTFLEISKGKFRQLKIKLPKDEKVLIDFEKEFEVIFNFIENLLTQNTKLREARDILLPKLMSGQIEV
jgi:type I restriction enzyme S subunit